MGRLTDRKFWDKRYADTAKRKKQEGHAAKRNGLGQFLDRARTRVGAEPMDSYSVHLVNKTMGEYLPRNSDWAVLEVGCAPGQLLMRLNRAFGYQPFGVEYSAHGVALTKELLRQNGFDANQVIEADFFSEEFLAKHENSFDVVISGGFIEHFDEPRSAVEEHVRLLKEGGFLVCTIPNLKSFAYPYLKLLVPDLIEAHNCAIMRLTPYEELFTDMGLKKLTCTNIGTFELFGSTAMGLSKSGFTRFASKVVNRFSDLTSHLLFFLLRGRSIETAWSPYLIFIGQKNSSGH